MRRRTFLAAAGTGAATLAGCLGDGGSDTTPTEDDGSVTTATETATPEPTPAERGDVPDGVYVQSFQETMATQGTATAGDYGFALLFAVPHDFWTVTGDTVSRTDATEADSLHLMASVWDRETRTAVPETGLSVEIARDGELVSQEVIYPMLSQPMGFHYGGNFELPEDGTYTATLSVGGTSTRRAGAFRDRLDDPATVEMELAYTEESRSQVRSRPIDQAGERGALRPMEMMSTPKAIAPTREEIPGTVRGSTTTDDARFLVTTLESADRIGESGPYLVVSPRTRYNGYVLPGMGLAATLTRDGETVFEGRLERTLGPELGYHYGAAVDEVAAGDELELSVDVPPQVARHEGYETAFLRFDDPAITL